MSYTMTFDMPQETAEYVEHSPQLRRDLNAIFIAVATMRMNECEDEGDRPKSKAGGATARWDELVAAGHGQRASQRLDSFVRGLPKLTGEPYRFRRADAYDAELA